MSTPVVLVVAAVTAGLAGWLAIPAGPPRVAPGASARVVTWVTSRRSRPSPVAITTLLDALAAELASGQPTREALLQAAASVSPPPCPRAVVAAGSGGDVARALRMDSARPGGDQLAALAACWEVAEHSGSGLATAVSRLAGGARETERSRAEFVGEVAAVRTSSRLLAALPVLGLAIAHWIGAEPLAWMLSSAIGRACLAGGLLLEAIGMWWLHRIVTTVSRSL